MVAPLLIVFDLDGTLVDSSVDLANAVNALLGELERPPLPTHTIIEMVGAGASVLVRRALAAASLDPDTPGALDRFLGHYDPHLLDHTRPYSGMIDVLDNLDGRVAMAVLTNKPARATQVMLDGRVLMVGDSTVDLATARNAGTRICLARYGFGYRFTAADFRGDELFIESPADLVTLISGAATSG